MSRDHELKMENEPLYNGPVKQEQAYQQLEKLNRPSFFSDQEYESAKKILLDSQAQFEKLVVIAEQQININHYEEAANAVLQAACFATEHHSGLYFSAPLEKILLRCANVLNDLFHPTVANLSEKSQPNTKRHVLHVLTEGYETGGHTRLMARWCERDTASVHSVIALVPLFRKVTPEWVAETAKKTGGWYCSLHDSPLGLCGRAKILRDIAYSWADVVVLHTHQFDPIATMAFGIEGGPPVIFLNHADHTFWLGVSVADIVANLRSAGQQITLKRRGTRRNKLLSIPMVSLSNPKYTQEEAKCKLGINKDTIVLLSIGSSYKYASSGAWNFEGTILNIVKKYDNIVAFIVGPNDRGNWNELKNETGNRIKAVGVQNDLEIFYRAADIYLDSFCMSSLTASLEAGLRGIPIVSLSNFINQSLSSDDVSLERGGAIYGDLNSYVKQVGHLIEQAEDRHLLGCKIAQKIKEDHIDNWCDSLNKIYCDLPQNHAIVTIYENVSQWNDGDIWWAYLRNQNK
jgi:hypothetical protein